MRISDWSSDVCSSDLCGAVDILVCNAGVPANKKSLDISADEWTQVVDVNLKGSWLVCNQAARRLVAAGRPGSIITITSILGHRVAASVLPSTASKAGLEQMTRPFALEGSPYGLRVDALAPGYFENNLNADFFAYDQGPAEV